MLCGMAAVRASPEGVVMIRPPSRSRITPCFRSGQIPGEHVQCTLRHGVGHVVRHGGGAGESGGDVDDPAAVPQSYHTLFDQEERCLHIDREEPVVLTFVALLDTAC